MKAKKIKQEPAPIQFKPNNVNERRRKTKPFCAASVISRPTASGIDSGFTLVELLVTVFLVGVGLIGVVSFFNASMVSQFEAKNEVIAAGLAQEGAELARNLVEYRRLNATSGVTWDTIADDLESNCHELDYNSLTSRTCQSGTNTYVCFSGSRYSQCSNNTQLMKRTYTFDHIKNANGNSLTIQVDVTWNDRKTTAKDIIYENTY